jgi:hypothetical protein
MTVIRGIKTSVPLHLLILNDPDSSRGVSAPASWTGMPVAKPNKLAESA